MNDRYTVLLGRKEVLTLTRDDFQKRIITIDRIIEEIQRELEGIESMEKK